MAIASTRYFGELEYTPDVVLYFPEGLLGFPENRRYVLVEEPASRPLSFLQNLEDPGLCFPVIPAVQADPGFRLSLDFQSCRLLRLPEGEIYPAGALLCLAVVTFDECGAASANLKGPLVVHVAASIGAQVVQFDADYPLRHPVPAIPEEVACS